MTRTRKRRSRFAKAYGRIRRIVYLLFVRLYRPLRAWFVGRVYKPLLYPAHRKFWPAIALGRRALLRKPLPKPCCRHEERTENVDVPGGRDLIMNRCTVCDAKHYELVVDPATVGVIMGQT